MEETSFQPIPQKTENSFKKFFKPRNFVFLILIIGIIFLGFYFWQKAKILPKPTYLYGYRLVNEKISQSAPIVIYLPEPIDKSIAQKNVKFYPEIEGEWLPSKNEKEIVFKPKEKLKLNRYYSVELTLVQSEKSTLKADFLVVEDPEILAIFPPENSETPENTEITIVFNRPMIPLTTLGYLEDQNIPVEITPATEGRFKWISTNNLQFIPKERLKRSSNYTVKVKSGLVSMDGLAVAGKEIKFITRKLRYLDLTRGQIIYNQPISLYFNQPVDLEKTKKEIRLINNATGEEIPFIVEYLPKEKKSKKEGSEEISGFQRLKNFLGSISAYLLDGKFDFKKEENVDRSIIQIYNAKDRFGREKFWDFENSYTLQIKKAYPEEGDIILNEQRTTNIFVGGIIKGISAESPRTKYASPDFFDPQGKLWVEFYEEIDLSQSKILAPKLKEINYGEKCKEEGVIEKIECQKIPDKKKIYLIFKSEEIGLEEKLEINFEKIVNTEGLIINQEPIKRSILSYPQFKILRTSPGQNSKGASLTEFILCSNTPILTPPKEDYDQYFKANLDYELNYWGGSYKITYWYQGERCQVGEFRTDISYGLMPLAEYSLELKLEDVFGQSQDLSLKFTTGEIPPLYLDFYHFQKPYNVTTPQKTKLTYAVKNMEYINLEICKLKSLDFLYYLEQKPKYYEPYIANCQKIVRKKIELPKRYWIKNYFQVDIKDYFPELIGHYILTFSHPDYKTEYWEGERTVYRQIYKRTYLTITNLAVAEKRILPQYASYGEKIPPTPEQLNQLNNLYWVTDIASLEPISGAKIDLYQKSKEEVFRLILADSYFTDEQGLSFTKVIPNLRGAIITKEKDSTVLPSRESKLEWVEDAFAAQKIYLYTDKPIYRPDQEVFFKGIFRIGYDGSYEIYQDKKINFKVFNSKGDEILNQDLEVNDFGTFNSKLILDREAPLGTYRACAEGFSCIYFDVLEYVPAPFEVKVKTDKEEYISKEEINLEVEANYYFGVPLEGGEVEYTVSSQNYYFDRYQDEYFDFDREWYYWPPYQYGEKFLLRGKTSLDSQGKAKISQLLDLEKLFKEKNERKSKIIIFDLTVKNPQGQSVSAQKSFLLHAGEFYLGIKADKSFLGKNEKTNIRIKSVDTQGKEKRVENINLALYKIDWIYSKRLDTAGNFSYKWKKKKDLVKEWKVNTDRRGDFSQELEISEEGEYELEISASDKRRNLVWSTSNLYVWGPKEVRIQPTTGIQLELEIEKTKLNVGDEGKIIIKSPYPKAKALISIERGKIFDYQIREIQGNLSTFNFRVKEEYLPNIFVSVLLLSPEPEIKFGKTEFKINTKQRELNIEVKSNKKYYLPGEEVTLDILAKDYQGNPVSAELSIAVVDLSVLALKGNPKKNPVIFFYDGFPLTVQTFSNIKDILVKTETPTKGGAGGLPEELAVKKRGIFKETAFWQAAVRTDENGYAQVKFALPDNLTTWQTETLSLTKDTKLGVNYLEFITKKELMVIPLKPRFVVPGDIFSIGAQIFNQSKEKQKITIRFESPTLLVKNDRPEKEIKIGAGKTETIYFQVEAPGNIEKGKHIFILSAQAKDLQDTVEMPIEITPNYTYEVTATSNYTPEKTAREYLFLPPEIIRDKGELSIKSSATLAVFLSDALNYLLGFPYGCSEQIASKLNAIAIVKKGLNLPNLAEKFKLEKIEYEDKEYTIEEVVQRGLAEIYNNQNYDGGFSFWRGGKSDFYLTLYLVETLNNLSLAGFKINKNSLNRASDYLYRQITTNREIFEDKNAVILTAYTLFRLPDFTQNGVLRQKIREIANDDLFIQEKISNSSLAYLAILLTKGFDPKLRNKIFDILDSRIDIDSRGAFVEIGKNFLRQYYETPIKNTALYLKAQVAGKRESPILDKVLRWLLNSRKKDGAWGSTNNTISVIDAFTEFLQWKRETESNFLLEVLVNEKKEGEFDFNPQTILDQFKKELPLRDLKFNEINTISFLKTNRNPLPNNLYYDLSLKYYLPIEKIPPRDEGFSIVREIYSLDDIENKNPKNEAKVGEVLRVHLQITVPRTRNYVMIEDFIPAGMEIVNLDLATEQKSLRLQERELKGREFIPDFKELHDDKVFLYKEELEPGVYEFDYYVRALIRGKFSHLPATVSEMYFPENFGRTAGGYFEVK